MHVQELKATLAAEPFRPFRLHFGSGKTVDVLNPGLVAVNNSGRTAFVFRADDSGWDIIDIMLIERIEFPEKPRRRRSA